MTHRWQVNSLAKGGYSSTPLFHKAVLKHKWLDFEIAILQKELKTELIKLEKYYLNYKPIYNLILSNKRNSIN